MRLFHLPALSAIVIVVAMVLGSYASLQRWRGGQLTLPESAAAVCAEEAPSGCAPSSLAPMDSEEELDGDEFLLAEPVSITVRRGRECSFQMLPVPCSHVGDLSRRPPRASLA